MDKYYFPGSEIHVDLLQASIIQERGLQGLPSNTKKDAKDGREWYKQFAR